MGLYIARDFLKIHGKIGAGLAQIHGILPGWKERVTFLRGEKKQGKNKFSIPLIGVRGETEGIHSGV